MKKKLSLILVMVLLSLTVLPVAAFAGGRAVDVGLSASQSGSTVTLNVLARDEFGQPANNAPLYAKMRVGIEINNNWQTHYVDMTLVSSNPSTGLYVYQATRPTGYTVGTVEVWFGDLHLGMNVWLTP
ncbi:hypothetical protein A7K91_17760 [Paenibacillus oryzae]|uniref:Uncharacterized protein n=1 Tax=Paenibacillus oryzae TaxID=1844972 RepID=A0A1A5YDU9_9BACL|nr:hypothetical protein [Paenibacillus oryzae]OBR63763.1 hypothetical protein A7K91_17760 [Paenibacillus oryzae]